MNSSSRYLTAAGILVLMTMTACGNGGAEESSAGGGGAAAAQTTASSEVSPTPDGVDDISALSGTYNFSIGDARINYATGGYGGAPVKIKPGGLGSCQPACTTLNVLGTSPSTETNFYRITGDIEVTCEAGTCSGGSYTFEKDPATGEILARVSGEPIDADAGVCGAPTVPNLGVLTLEGDTVTFLDGQGTPVAQSDCVQVIWRVVAKRV